jgi:hypothetical protein
VNTMVVDEGPNFVEPVMEIFHYQQGDNFLDVGVCPSSRSLLICPIEGQPDRPPD